jgi:hypothetical protein
MKHRLVLLIFIILIGFTSCGEDKTDNKIDSFMVEYAQLDGWIDYSHTVAITQEGLMQVVYKGGLDNGYREYSCQVDDAAMKLLRDNLIILASIDLKDKYGFGELAPTDGPVTRYRYTTEVRSDSTLLYFPEENELPDQLKNFISVLDTIIKDYDTLLYIK